MLLCSCFPRAFLLLSPLLYRFRSFSASESVALACERFAHHVNVCHNIFSHAFFDAALGAKGSYGATGRRRPARSLQGLLRGGGLDGQADKPPGGAAHGIRGMASHSIGLCRGGLHGARRLPPIRPRGLARGQHRGAERPRRSGAAAAPKERYGPAQDRL